MKKRLGIAVTLVAFALVSAAIIVVPATAQTPTDIARKVVCMCGCNSVLDACPHKECMVGEEMKATIRTKLAAGQTETQIIQSFVAQYGEQVLAAPTKKGFNLTAWITPFAALAAGALAVYFVLTQWVFRGRQAAVPVKSQEPVLDDAYRQRVEQELAELRRKEGGH